MTAIKSPFSAVESHIANESVKQYFHFQKGFIRSYEQNFPTMLQDHALVLAFKEVKVTAGSTALVPTLLISGVLSSISALCKQLRNQVERTKVMKNPKNGMIETSVQQKFSAPFSRNALTATEHESEIDTNALMSREDRFDR